MQTDELVVTGAREHNLKGITVRVPKNRLVVFTGVSGSGKSSLAFDTLYAEGQRRYVESLSAYARQFLGRLERPRYETIRGLSPTIAIEQRTSSSNPRSTVATITEIADYLRVLYARAGEPHCPECGRAVAAQSAAVIVRRLLAHPPGTTLTLLAPIVDARKGEHREALDEARKKGFTRARIDGTVHRLDAVPSLEPKVKHSIELVVDRITLKEGIEARLTDSVETALRAGSGRLVVSSIPPGAGPSPASPGAEPSPASPGAGPSPASEETLSETSACPVHGISIPELTPQLFSWNAPQGMCTACQGLGSRMEVDEGLLIPDPSLSIDEGAIALFRGSGVVAGLQKVVLEAVVKEFKIDTGLPFRKLPPGQRAVLLEGKPGRDLKVRLASSKMQTDWTTQWIGLKPLVEKKFRDTSSEDMRHYYMRFFSSTPCDACGGTRLNPISRAVEVGGKALPQLLGLGVAEAHRFFEELDLPGSRAVIAADLVREVRARLRFLVDVGLPYLTLDRSGASLSGGEAQRIRLASQVGLELTGVLYVLDEPSVGLHARDTARLIGTLARLRDLGNTVLVVEHDAETIRAADHVVDFGPGAGARGGEVMAEGTPDEVAADARSLTGAYLSGRQAIPLPARRRKGSGSLVLRGAMLHNLKGEDVTFPLGTLVAVTGVSGAGKSSLVTGTLEPLLAERLMGATRKPGPFSAVEGIEQLDKMVAIDQRAIGLTPRSNPATYVKAFDEIRQLFASLTESKTYGFAPGRFSFNVKGGRCEACEGDGVVRVEMHFLPDVFVTCDVCGGKRFNEATLRVRFKGKSIADVLELTVAEAIELFADVPRVARPLRTLDAVGLGYVQLGQPSTTLSGGEAQRVKLSRELARTDTGRTFYILDEPTTGLHFEDVRRLLLVLDRLVEAGNTVLVIEHNLEVVKCADWVVDVGPEGGAQGGHVVAAGTPEQVAKMKASHTGGFLRGLLGGSDRHAGQDERSLAHSSSRLLDEPIDPVRGF